MRWYASVTRSRIVVTGLAWATSNDAFIDCLAFKHLPFN